MMQVWWEGAHLFAIKIEKYKLGDNLQEPERTFHPWIMSGTCWVSFSLMRIFATLAAAPAPAPAPASADDIPTDTWQIVVIFIYCSQIPFFNFEFGFYVALSWVTKKVCWPSLFYFSLFGSKSLFGCLAGWLVGLTVTFKCVFYCCFFNKWLQSKQLLLLCCLS